jgi:uncharacterized delta-60 repeat protein
MKRIKSVLLTLIIFAVGFTVANLNTVRAAPGDLDISFGNAGKVVIGNTYDEDRGYAIALQADGKILLGGFSYNNTSNNDFALARFNSDGTLDTSFNGDGLVITDIANSIDMSYTLAIQPDSKILLGGSGWNGSNLDFTVVRFNSDGTLDNSFDNDGIVSTTIGSGFGIARTLAIQPDGKILLGGDGDGLILVRYNNNGSLDSGFGTDGIVNTDIGAIEYSYAGINAFAYAVAVQPDGKILFGGESTYNVDMYSNFALIRYNSDGTLDTTFDDNGIVTTDIDNYSDTAYALTVLPNGKTLLGGMSYTGTDYAFALVRYNNNGSVDTDFGTSGKVITPIGSDDARAYALVAQPDGKILLSGYSVNSGEDFTLARYNNDGSPDTSFGAGDGIVTVDIDNTHNVSTALALQPDGNILLGGYSYTGGIDFALIRILANDNNDDGIAEAWDLTPDDFSFTDTINVITSTIQTSENITISGLGANITVPVTAAGGEYAINDGNYTSDIGYVQNGDIISVRHTASNSALTTTNTVLTIGGLHTPNNTAVMLGTTASDIFTNTTEPGPNAFSFTDVTGVTLASTTISNSITISGMTHAMAISVANGEYSVNSGSFTNTNGNVVNGDNVRVRHTSASTASTSVNTTLIVGGMSDTFTSTTAATASSGGGSLSWPLFLMLGLPLLRSRRI